MYSLRMTILLNAFYAALAIFLGWWRAATPKFSCRTGATSNAPSPCFVAYDDFCSGLNLEKPVEILIQKPKVIFSFTSGTFIYFLFIYLIIYLFFHFEITGDP